MRRRQSLVTIGLVLSMAGVWSSSPTTNAHSQAPVSELSKAHHAIATITGEDKNGGPVAPGTGFFVSDTLVATDYRVIKDAITIHVKREGSQDIEARVTGVDRERLVALLIVDRSATPHLRLACETALERGAITHAVEIDGTSAESTMQIGVQAVSEGTGTTILDLDRALSTDRAGTPLLNERGEVVAVAVRRRDGAQSPSIAASIVALKSLVGGACESDRLRLVHSGDVPSGVPGGVPGGTPGGVPAHVTARTPTEPANADTSQPRPTIIRRSGGILQGSAIRRAEPQYPPLAKAARISGSVVIEVTVDEEGDVILARSVSGHPLLKTSAENAARGWKFSPTLLEGTPVKVIGTITFNFGLDSSTPQTSDNSPPDEANSPIDSRPVMLKMSRPKYTELARSHKVTGIVRVRALIGADGKVEDVRVLSGLPDGLNEQAVAAVRDSVFRPAMKDGHPVKFWLNMDVSFNLR